MKTKALARILGMNSLVLREVNERKYHLAGVERELVECIKRLSEENNQQWLTYFEMLRHGR